jgi:2-polyprenyl-3-methyl-5-hydroxy-6-metoxy-1,4-benzoquinol methylase
VKTLEKITADMRPEDLFSSPELRRLSTAEKSRYSAAYFKSEYWKEDLPGQRGNRGLSYEDVGHQARFDWLFEVTIGGGVAGKVLDAGCGPGHLLERALRSGLNATGLDVSEAALAAFLSRVPSHWQNRFRLAELFETGFNNGTFHTTVCSDVLEHLVVTDALRAVVELCRITSKEIICSINIDNPYQFHPTILSRASWESLFQSYPGISVLRSKTDWLNERARERYPEYDFFVFAKGPAL